jgi:hypothetical protein
MAKRTSGENPHDLYNIIVKKKWSLNALPEWRADSFVNRKVLRVVNFLLANRKWDIRYVQQLNVKYYWSAGCYS